MQYPLWTLFFSFFYTIQAVASSCEQLPEEQMLPCAKNFYQQADQQLNQIYQKISKILDKNQSNALKEAQRAWLKYRDSQCLAQKNNTPQNAETIYQLCMGAESHYRVQSLQRIYLANAHDAQHFALIKTEDLLGSWRSVASDYGLELTFGINDGVHYFMSHLNSLPFEAGQWQWSNGQLTLTSNDQKVLRTYHQVDLKDDVLSLYEQDGGLEQFKKIPSNGKN
jgi:uncharacterized protein YecT (DUF1311 family)